MFSSITIIRIRRILCDKWINYVTGLRKRIITLKTNHYRSYLYMLVFIWTDIENVNHHDIVQLLNTKWARINFWMKPRNQRNKWTFTLFSPTTNDTCDYLSRALSPRLPCSATSGHLSPPIADVCKFTESLIAANFFWTFQARKTIAIAPGMHGRPFMPSCTDLARERLTRVRWNGHINDDQLNM